MATEERADRWSMKVAVVSRVSCPDSLMAGSKRSPAVTSPASARASAAAPIN